MRLRWGAVAGLLWLTLASLCSAQEGAYPARPVTIINPWPAGTSLDAVIRGLAEGMQRQSKAVFVVENVGGAGSVIGTLKAAKSKPDGYTLLYGSSSGLVIAPQVNVQAKYDALEMLDPISLIAVAPSFIVVPANSPYRTLRELVEAARAKPNDMRYSTNGIGSSFHLTALTMTSATQTSMLHVPFKGAGEALTSLMRGEVDWTYQLADVLPLARAGKFRVLAVTHPTRLPYAPEVPTVQEELGMPGLEASVWVCMLAPKGTSPAQLSVINQMIAGAMKDPAVQVILERGGFIPSYGTPGQLRDFISKEHDRWGQVIRANGIKVE